MSYKIQKIYLVNIKYMGICYFSKENQNLFKDEGTSSQGEIKTKNKAPRQEDEDHRQDELINRTVTDESVRDNSHQNTTTQLTNKKSNLKSLKDKKTQLEKQLRKIQTELQPVRQIFEKVEHDYRVSLQAAGLPQDWKPDSKKYQRGITLSTKNQLNSIFMQKQKIQTRLDKIQEEQHKIQEFISYYQQAIRKYNNRSTHKNTPNLVQYINSPTTLQQENRILQKFTQAQDFSKKSISQYTHHSIKSIQLCISYNFNETNPKQNIEKIQHLLLIVRLDNESIFGGYAQNASSNLRQKKGFIFSMAGNGKEVYYLKKNHQVLENKPGYLIFGKSEISLKLDSQLVYLTVGREDGCYQSQKSGYNVLLNSGKSKVAKIERYRIYKVDFY